MQVNKAFDTKNQDPSFRIHKFQTSFLEKIYLQSFANGLEGLHQRRMPKEARQWRHGLHWQQDEVQFSYHSPARWEIFLPLTSGLIQPNPLLTQNSGNFRSVACRIHLQNLGGNDSDLTF